MSIVLHGARVTPAREIRRLDPVADHSRIVYLDTCFEFPWDTTRSLELALFRTFAVPSVAAVLDASGEFGRAPQKRYDDTDLILSTIVEAGYDSDEGKRAIRRMNRIHGRFEISNDDFLYVLSSFVFEPISWNARFGWRPLIETEKLATFEFWREVGRRMAISEIPESYAELEAFNEEYERRHFRRTEQSERVGRATRDMFLAWFPGLPKRFGAQGDLRADGRAAARCVRVSAPAASTALHGGGRAEDEGARSGGAAPTAQSTAAHATQNAHLRPALEARRAGAGPAVALAPPHEDRPLDGERRHSRGSQAQEIDHELGERAAELAPVAVGGGDADIGGRRDRRHRDQDADQCTGLRRGQREDARDSGEERDDHGVGVRIGDEERRRVADRREIVRCGA